MWLLEQSVYNTLNAARSAGVTLTSEQQQEYNAMGDSSFDGCNNRILSIAGATAEIKVSGVLTKSPDFISMLFGGGNTTYSDIMSAISHVEQDPEISDVVFAIDSPGGSIDGLFDTISAMQHMKKRKRAVVSGLAASAAYAIASQSGQITASNKAARFGSIGVRADFDIDDDTVVITSTNAPRKAPDVTTDEGVEMVREELDALHDIFIESIAAGRGVDIEKINTSFGRGGTLLANEALKRGMIDSIGDKTLNSVSNTNFNAVDKDGGNIKVKNMDLSKLKAEHPATYAAAVAVGVENGITAERDRIGQHLIMGESSGDMKTAIAACKEGTEMTGVMQATYLSAGMNKADIDARAADENNAGDNVDNTEGNTHTSSAEKDAIEIANGIAAMNGMEVSL